jgi:phosphate transport system permease protein
LATHDLTAAGAPPGPRLRASRRRWGEDAVRVSLLVCAAVSVATTVGIVVALVQPAIDFFREINPIDFITGTRWAPLFSNADFGVVPLLTGTFSVTIWASLVCIPFGLGAAIYLSEYAHPRVRRTLKPMLELLAGIPTVVFGYFALLLVTPLLRDIGLDVSTFNALSAGLVVGFLVLPTVVSLSEDAMSAVPMDLRAGAYALGATRLKVSTRVVVPAAISGIIASFVLAISRIVGETMVVLIAAGQQPTLSLDPRSQTETMTAFIGATGQGDVPTGSIEYKTIFAVGLTLFVITLVMNVISIRLVRKYREIYE